MKPIKPYLTYDQQVDLLVSRGMVVADREAATDALRRIGYYRLSAYTYVFRPPAQDGEQSRRSDEFVEGATFAHALGLHDFDDRLRSVLPAGLQQLEVALRTRVGHELGRRDSLAHLDPTHLDQKRCEAPAERPRVPGDNAYDDWRRRFDDQVSDAKTEDFVKHHWLHYDGKMPVWVAVEVMTFGTLTRLYGLLRTTEANAVARSYSVDYRDLLSGWLRSLTPLRNHCAHNARIWNRATPYPAKKGSRSTLPPDLVHLVEVDNLRIYHRAAITAHLLRAIDRRTRWPQHFVEVMKKFPDSPQVTVEQDMGFSTNWRALDLWQPLKR
ncbi:MAG: Abi family protein [Micrococcales bacterium]|nr:Abi family protein [Micrococcales bacterium]MCL2667503.1 Abi family protein [Micrococcales bacterium]